MRRVSCTGQKGDSKTINATGEATGMQRMARSGQDIVFAWIAAGHTKSVLTAKAQASAL